MTFTVAAIITARGGSKSIYKKNIILINEKPLLSYPINAAKSSATIDHTFVDTDCPDIASIAKQYGAKVINRPYHLSGDTTDHGDVIRHAANEILNLTHIDIFVVLLGNTVMIDQELINRSVNLLIDNDDATGVCSVWQAADDHPQRAMMINDQGLLEGHSSVIRQHGATTDRSSYVPAYFYDQGVWAFRATNLLSSSGPATWNWLGDKVLPIIRPWITGRDINGPFDYNYHKYWQLLRETPKNFELPK
ncbi:cytidylyltransferase domain-containing protein [Synechococcus sp. N19]|uniref:acylneuraminate cytidylyltransferase family protein n=1 Tax=Synechococcus sp. N19 TaxID=2575512 RepID=UPI000E0FFAD6|nr:hypothetical protein [Synechococcus sp. N19]